MSRTAAPELRVGITTRNDAQALELCLDTLARTLVGVSHEIVVVDWGSDDGTVEVARRAGAKVVVRRWLQPDALNYLLATSRSSYTLLLHSDVALLADDWYPLVSSLADGPVVLVSPDDVGVGPHLRASYGAGKPESSFLFWRTEEAQRLRTLRPRHLQRALREGLPFRVINLYHLHVTHYLPSLLAARRLAWRAMDVLPSPSLETWYEYTGGDPAATWEPAWGALEYGFGNFYAIDGRITHFHQWYARHSNLAPDELNDDGVPAGFLKGAAERFRRDYYAGRVKLPDSHPQPTRWSRARA